ncbi:MAG: ABC transporter ATP-binding protein [Clostridia bacterium]|nr:ABC transporter ATP-binding protein [Clostridia bacterium]
MISINQLSFQYEGGVKPALVDITLEIPDGDFIGIIGRSGAGKSTLTYALNGIVPHYHKGDFYGSVTVDGMDTVETTPERLAELVGSVLQDTDAQMITSTVIDELQYGLISYGIDDIDGRVDEALAALGIADLREREINSLSGGQRQKVAIASILALKPKIFILDEPTSELDPASSRMVFELLRTLNQTGVTVIVVEQKIMQLCEFCDRLIVLDGGAVAFDGGVREVLTHSEELEAIGVHVPRIVTLAKTIGSDKLPLNLDEAEAMLREVLA